LDNAVHLGNTVFNKAWAYAFPAKNNNKAEWIRFKSCIYR
jgi:hypothetical protein